MHGSHKISTLLGADIYLKFENLQHSGSFKARGSLNFLLGMKESEKSRGVIAMSAGNHAQGVAYHANRLGIQATIIMPSDTPYVKVRNTESYGAVVKLHGTLDQAREYALKLAEENGYTFVHPYDSPLIIAGQGTVALEMLHSMPDLECIVAPIGGGGLISGIAIAAKAINPAIKIYGVQTTAYPSMKNCVNNKPLNFVGGSTIAEGLAVKAPGKITREIVKRFVEDIILVEEKVLERSLVLLLDREKTLVEGAGAASLAGVVAQQDAFEGKKVGVVLSGGNIDQRILSSVLMRDMVSIGRLGRLRIYMSDQPGMLSLVSKIIGDCRANIIEVTYQPIFCDATAKETSIEMAIETRDKQEFTNVIKVLNAQGYRTESMSVL